VKRNLRGINLCISLEDVRDSTDDRSQYNFSPGQVLKPAVSRCLAECSQLTATFDQEM